MSTGVTSPIVIVGAGYIGRELHARLGPAPETVLLSARDVMSASEAWLDSNVPRSGAIVFAHGRSVNVRGFRHSYDDILDSRLLPLKRLASRATRMTAILVSSTVAAGEGSTRSLPELQRVFEQRFKQLYGSGRHAILRVGTIVGPGAQFTDGLHSLSRTNLLKRLRSCSSPRVPYADADLVASAVDVAIATAESERWIVVYPIPLDLNRVLDGVCRSFRIYLPHPIFAAVWQLLGVRTDFMAISPADLRCEGWRPAPRRGATTLT